MSYKKSSVLQLIINLIESLKSENSTTKYYTYIDKYDLN